MKVYREFDRAALDREYSARGTVSDEWFEAVIGRYGELSAHCRETLECRLDVAYGPSPDEVVDIFPARGGGGGDAPLFVFIHGGYWRMLSQRESCFMAECFTRQGAAAAAVNYSLAPAVGLDEIVRQCRAALAWLHANARSFGADPARIHIGGSSAGGHLVGMLLARDWHRAHGAPDDVVKSACAISGLHDLEPVRLAEPNSWIRLDAAAARRNSPIHHIPDAGGCPLIVSYGGNETGEFKRQTDDYAAAWRARGFAATHIEMDHADHFDIVLDLCDRDGKLTRAVFDEMGI